MSTSNQVRKPKITLSDYPYHKDIENRLFLAQLTVAEVSLLQEIVHHSLRIPIDYLASELQTPVSTLLPILDKLSETKLFKRQQMDLIVDKELRKYYESQFLKFDEDFYPDLNYFQGLLNRLPIHVIPVWYAISRSSDNIFESLVDKYFSNPKSYRQYLSELEFESPALAAIITDVHQAPGFRILASEIMQKYQLSRPAFEEYLLLLEFHFACCLSYARIDGLWQEVVIPFTEWFEYLQFENNTKPKTIQEPIEKTYYVEFNFIKDLTALLHACEKSEIPQDFSGLIANSPEQKQILIKKLIQLEFVKEGKNKTIIATDKGKTWSSKTLFMQVSQLALDPLNTPLSGYRNELWNMRNLYLVEKSLRDLQKNQWVFFDSFFQGFIAPISDKEAPVLKNKGKKWKYVIPTYTQAEKDFVQSVIMDRLAELGIVSTGFYEGRPCFCLTTFGSQFIH